MTHTAIRSPLPTGRSPRTSTLALADLEVGQSGVFTRVSDSDPAMLRYLSDRISAPVTESS